MIRIAFVVSDKARTVHFGNTLRAGARAHGDEVKLLSKDDVNELKAGDFDGIGIMGIAQQSIKVRDLCASWGIHYLVFDKGYCGRDRYTRVSVDGWQPLHYFQQKRPMFRLERLMRDRSLRVEPRKVSGKRVLLAGHCQAHANYHGLGDVQDYHQAVASKLLHHTDKLVSYRPNPSWARRHGGASVDLGLEPVQLSSFDVLLQDVLPGTHLLVTHGSSAAFAAYSAGVPVMTLGGGITRPIGLTEEDFEEIDTPVWPDDDTRYQFFADVAYCQWTAEEYASGEAWATIKEQVHGNR